MDLTAKDLLISTWNKEAENYQPDAAMGPDYQAYFAELEANLGPVKNKKILDAGSGTGTADAYLAGKGAQLYLVDISDKALGFQKKYFKSLRVEGKFFRQDLFKMNFAPASFDAVFNGGVIEHFDDEMKVEMIKIMWRLVKPGGRLLIGCPNAGDIPFMIAKKILELRHKWAFGKEDDLTGNRLSRLMKRAGIRNFEIYAYNPIVGWWFLPFGKEFTTELGLNQVNSHRRKSLLGHVLMLTARKNQSDSRAR